MCASVCARERATERPSVCVLRNRKMYYTLESFSLFVSHVQCSVHVQTIRCVAGPKPRKLAQIFFHHFALFRLWMCAIAARFAGGQFRFRHAFAFAFAFHRDQFMCSWHTKFSVFSAIPSRCTHSSSIIFFFPPKIQLHCSRFSDIGENCVLGSGVIECYERRATYFV